MWVLACLRLVAVHQLLRIVSGTPDQWPEKERQRLLVHAAELQHAASGVRMRRLERQANGVRIRRFKRQASGVSNTGRTSAAKSTPRG